MLPPPRRKLRVRRAHLAPRQACTLPSKACCLNSRSNRRVIGGVHLIDHIIHTQNTHGAAANNFELGEHPRKQGGDIFRQVFLGARSRPRLTIRASGERRRDPLVNLRHTLIQIPDNLIHRLTSEPRSILHLGLLPGHPNSIRQPVPRVTGCLRCSGHLDQRRGHPSFALEDSPLIHHDVDRSLIQQTHAR